MGRRKIAIASIDDKRKRLTTFSKRSAGVLKKAWEIGELCNVVRGGPGDTRPHRSHRPRRVA